MKKVVNTEEYYKNNDEKGKKGLKVLAAVALALLVTTLTVPQEEWNKAVNKIKGYFGKQEPKAQTELLEETEEKEEQEEKTAKIAIYEMDEGLIEITEPVTEEIGGVTYYYAPKGFSMINDICYRVVTWDTEEQYEAKNLVGINGQIPVNDKLISIVRPQIRVVDNRLMYSLPEGYLKVGDYGIKVSVIAKEETNTLGR